MSTKDKWVRRFTVDETAKHKNGFTIYKITSVLFPLESPEAVTVVSVWKRYSDVQALHRSVKALHSGLHLRGNFPILPKNSYFKRFHSEVIEERAKSIKSLLEFIAEHRLLFTSTVFVNFLQTGFPEPVPHGGVINAIRSSLHLPIEETPPLEYQTSDDESRSPHSTATPQEVNGGATSTHDQELDVSQIPIYEAADVELRESPKHNSRTDSFESIDSLDSVGSDFYRELNKISIGKTKPSVKNKNVLPDLINFDAPSTSDAYKFDDYHTTRPTDTDTASVASPRDSTRASPRDSPDIRPQEMEDSYVFESPVYDREDVSPVTSSRAMDTDSTEATEIYEGLVSSLSGGARVKETEDSYVFEAGYLLSLGARSEDSGHYRRAFHCYRAGIEKMLIGVRSDSDGQRRAVIKEKINKYLSYAETIYSSHLLGAEHDVLSGAEQPAGALSPPPLSMLRRGYAELALYRVLAVLGPSVMLVLHRHEQTCYAMKVIRKIPHNLTEFDEYFLQRTNETRQPVLPTLIPYMVPLHAYVETNSLIFLILSYAPGKKLFDYIKDYSKSVPSAPSREVNLENVFTEPTKTKTDFVNDNIDEVDSVTEVLQDVNENLDLMRNIGKDMSVNELVRNSQRLLKNVDKVLTEVRDDGDVKVEDVRIEVKENEAKRCDVEREDHTALMNRAVPRRAVCCWAAQLLVAIEALHNCGVICGDLHPRNILLGEKGQIILTYFIYYPGVDMALSKTKRASAEAALHVAPELYRDVFPQDGRGGRAAACDFWSYGALLYQLICGVPLSCYHREMFSSHTLLQLPDGLPLEEQSLLTQLLVSEPAQRLGGGAGGVDEIKQHPYFRGVDWARVRAAWTVPR